MQLREAMRGEGALLSEIALRSKAHWGYDTAFLKACREALTVSEAYIASNHVYALVNEGHILGFFSFVIQEDGAELDNFFLDSKYIGQGFGRILWQSAVQKARELRIREFTIQADPHALGFYEKMGAVRIGEANSSAIKGRKLPLLTAAVTAP